VPCLVALCTAFAASCKPAPAPLPDSLAEGCLTVGCHATVENIHYGGPRLRCVDCHLGNPNATTKAEAHVTVDISLNPSSPGTSVRESPAMTELDEIPNDVMQFLNPADYRVVRKTCGSAILAGGGCHTAITEASLLLNRATLAGTFAGGGFIAGVQDRKARYAIAPVQDELATPSLAPNYAPSLAALPETVPADVSGSVSRAFYPVYEQLCTECHVRREGRKEPGLYYASGCAACHMVSRNDARTKSEDFTQNRDELGHPETHRFTNLIPDSQCAHCHISHLSRSLLAQGVRERSEPEGDKAIGGPNRGLEDPPNAVPWAKENYVKSKGLQWAYGKPYPYFLADEDGTNGVDETPPDIHTEKGMACIDCHNMREAHGGKHMADRMDMEIDVRCQSCHGRPGEMALLTSDAGLAFVKAGTAAGNIGFQHDVFKKLADGTIQQADKLTGNLHPVTQITTRQNIAHEKYNPRTRMGCELHAGAAAVRAKVKAEVNALAKSDPAAVATQYPGLPAGFTFDPEENPGDGRVECFTCHNRWTVNCYGCHVVRDDREAYTSRLTGAVRQGRVSTYGLSVVADALALGFNSRGRISPMVGTSLFFTHIGADGTKLIDASPLTTADGLAGEGNVHNPVHHHTIRQKPRDCTGCHPAADDTHDVDTILRAVGLGTGKFTFVDGSGHTHWLDRLVWADYDGDGTHDDPSVLGIPSQLFNVERVVATTHLHLPQTTPTVSPGPLDLDTIRRTLKNRVLPQRAPGFP